MSTHTVKVKVENITERALDWAVAKCMGLNPNTDPETRKQYVGYAGFAEGNGFGYAIKHYSSDWAQGGPIIEREHINIRPTFTEGGYRTADSVDAVNAKIDLPNGAKVFDPSKVVQEYGPTPLIAAMRCYVASKLGDEIEIPRELA